MNTQAQLPYLLLGVGTTAPDCLVIHLGGTEKAPSMKRTLFRRPGEDEGNFWRRVEREARELADPFDLFPRAGYIYFDYSRSAAEDDGDNGDARHNWRMQLHFWCRSDLAEIRLMAATALGELCGLLPPEGAEQARH